MPARTTRHIRLLLTAVDAAKSSTSVVGARLHYCKSIVWHLRRQPGQTSTRTESTCACCTTGTIDC